MGKEYLSQNVAFNVIFNILSWFLSVISLYNKTFFLFPCWGQSYYRAKQIIISFFISNVVKWWEEMYQSDVFPPSLFSFVKWDINKTLDLFKVLVAENLAIFNAEHNRKITRHILKSISFPLVLQGLGKEGENKTM